MNKIFNFHQQIGKTMELDVDNILAKSKEAQDHVTDFFEMFDIFR